MKQKSTERGEHPISICIIKSVFANLLSSIHSITRQFHDFLVYVHVECIETTIPYTITDCGYSASDLTTYNFEMIEVMEALTNIKIGLQDSMIFRFSITELVMATVDADDLQVIENRSQTNQKYKNDR